MNSEEEGLQIGNLLRKDIGNVLPPEFISSLLAMFIVIVLVFVVFYADIGNDFEREIWFNF